MPSFRVTAFVTALLLPVGAPAPSALGPQIPKGKSLAPYVSTPQEVVDLMLTMAEVRQDDILYDLGCGDGRIPITAAKRYGARAIGVDIDPRRILESRVNARAAGVDHLARFVLQDAMTVDVSSATVVTLYLLSDSNMRLRTRLTTQLRPGARIVSHSFNMEDWKPTRTDEIDDRTGVKHRLYLWKTDGVIR